jgi:hypothetical protein
MEESEPPRRRSSRSSRRARARAWKTEGSALELVRDLTWPKLAPCQHSVICPRHFSPLEKNATRRSLITKICPRGKCPHELARHRGRAPPPRCRALEPVGVATRATQGPTPRTGAGLGRTRERGRADPRAERARERGAGLNFRGSGSGAPSTDDVRSSRLRRVKAGLRLFCPCRHACSSSHAACAAVQAAKPR